MIKMIASYDFNIWMLECEHVYSWNLYGDELCDYWMQMYWFMTIDVVGGTTGIRSVTEQGHPTGWAGRWFPPFSCIMLMFWNELFEDDILLHYDEC
jgi:hypothetical protein